MITIPENAQSIAPEGATVSFLQFEVDENTYYSFDTSKCAPPEPMVNAMVGLRLLDSKDKKLLMINHKSPGGLLDKLGNDFEVAVSTRGDGLVEVVFGLKELVDINSTKYTSLCH